MNSYNSIITNPSKSTVLFQKILLVLSISLGLNFVPNVIFPIYDVAPMVGVTTFLFLFLMSRGLKDVLITFIVFWHTKTRFRKIFFPIVFLFLFEIFRFPVNPGNSIYVFIILPILLCLFFIFIVDIFTNFCNNEIQQFLNKYIKSYFFICNVIVLISVAIFILVKVGLVDMYQWTNVSLYGSDFQIRQDYMEGVAFSNPFYLTIISPFFVKTGNFFGELGTFSGWSYEPHVACFFLTPAFLMINYFEKNKARKYILVISYFLFYILSLSLTAIIGLVIVLIMYFISMKNKTIKQKLLIFVSFILLIALTPLLVNYFSEQIMYSQEKLDSQASSSSSYGITFNYIFSPNTFFGDGLLKAPMGGDVSFATGEATTLNVTDIGIIPFINFLWFYSVILIISLKTTFKKNQFDFIGLILIYLIFHSMKFPFHVFHYPFVFLFYFILSILPKEENQ